MAKKKAKSRKLKPLKVYPRTDDVLRFIAKLLQGSRDINVPDKAALAELVKHLKD